MAKTKITELTAVIMKELKNYEKATIEDMREVGKEVAKEGAKILKETSPEKTGVYKKGWTVKETPTTKGCGFVVHNSKKPGLTHLLEEGHAMRNGGRSKKIVHIKPAEEWCNEEFEKRLIRRLEK